jgi:bifunctional non-homologous end joining protein LigD
MALEEYRRKRDFRKTPEPEGKAVKSTGRERFFCVQKHLATQLHYDFRLEHNGVLLSWAVPKGPSLDPRTKRLAMQVEDHPIDYGDFEGVIPEGYGAGIVMLWDVGTWTPETDDVDRALAKGDLKLTLNGYKLKGSWVLVRTSGSYGGARGQAKASGGSGARTWLLIKHRDEWSGDLDITEFAPKSVKSNGDFEEILAEDTPAVWLSNRPAKSGEAGQMLSRIIERVAKLKSERASPGREKAASESKAGRADTSGGAGRKGGADRKSGAGTKGGAAGAAKPRARARPRG